MTKVSSEYLCEIQFVSFENVLKTLTFSLKIIITNNRVELKKITF